MARTKPRGRSIASAVTAALFVGVLAAPVATVEAQPICTWTIGVMGALEGQFGRIGEPAANGVRVAVDQANESGRLSCWLDVRAEDTQGDPNQAPRKARGFVEDEHVVACVCGFFSGETLASGMIFSEGGVAMLSTGEIPLIRKQGFETWFRLIAPSDSQATSTGVFMKRSLNARRVAIVHDDQSYSVQMAKDVAAKLGKRFDKPFFVINPEETDYSAVVAKLEKRKPGAIFYAGYDRQAWPLKRQLDEAGVRATFVTDAGAKNASVARRAEAGNAYVSCACNDPKKFGAAADSFVAEYRRTYASAPRYYAADTFDGANFVVDALEELSGAESIEEARAHVVAYLDAVEDGEGTVKTYSWDDKGELQADNRHTFMWEWAKRKGFEMLGPVATLVD